MCAENGQDGRDAPDAMQRSLLDHPDAKHGAAHGITRRHCTQHSMRKTRNGQRKRRKVKYDSVNKNRDRRDCCVLPYRLPTCTYPLPCTLKHSVRPFISKIDRHREISQTQVHEQKDRMTEARKMYRHRTGARAPLPEHRIQRNIENQRVSCRYQ